MVAAGVSLITVMRMFAIQFRPLVSILRSSEAQQYIAHCNSVNTVRDAMNSESILVAELMQMLERVRQSAT